MKKVITYGTYDLLHQGHINLLRRAKELGDYLIVGALSTMDFHGFLNSGNIQFVKDDVDVRFHKELAKKKRCHYFNYIRIIRRIIYKLTVGVYDMLHIGHMLLFKRTKELGDKLIVAVQDSDVILKYKPGTKMVYTTEEKL